MTKQKILETFKDINQMYNNANMLDELSRMLDELEDDAYNKGFEAGQHNMLEAQAEASWGGE